jgi:hypothetical protein
MDNVDTIRILATEPDRDDGLIVTFSDGTTGAYVVEELLELRPHREPVKNGRIEDASPR